MTEPIRPAYEQIRDNVEDADVRASWRDGDRWNTHLRERYASIDADEELSAEGKQQKMQQDFEAFSPRAAKGYAEAREKARKLADSYHDSSIPMPDGKVLSTARITDAAELAAVQAETEALLLAARSGGLSGQIAQRTGRRPRNVRDAGDGRLEALRAAYESGLKAGGIEGKVRCHAALRAAERLSLDVEEVVSGAREDKHRDFAERARRYEQVARTIPPDSYVPTPPASPRAPKGMPGTYQQRPLLIPKGGRESGSGGQSRIGAQLFPQKRRRSWK